MKYKCSSTTIFLSLVFSLLIVPLGLISADPWKDINKKSENAICLILTSYEIYVNSNLERPLHSSACWGTGFLASKCGFVLTNKHVAEPWKTDPIAQALIIDPKLSALVVPHHYLWFAGTKFRSTKDKYDFENAYSSERENLFLLELPYDVWNWGSLGDFISKQELSEMGKDVASSPSRILDLGSDDFAVMWIDEKPDKLPLPLNLQRNGLGVEKLDQCLVIGFPSSDSFMGGSEAVPTSLMAVVRKIDKMIEVSASSFQGNSGGPLIAENGSVVGIISSVASFGSGNPNHFFCIKMDDLKSISPFLFSDKKPEIYEYLVRKGYYRAAMSMVRNGFFKNSETLKNDLDKKTTRELLKLYNNLIYFIAISKVLERPTWDNMAFSQQIQAISFYSPEGISADSNNSDAPAGTNPFVAIFDTADTEKAWKMVADLRSLLLKEFPAASGQIVSPEEALQTLTSYYGAIISLGDENKTDDFRAYHSNLQKMYEKNSSHLVTSYCWGDLLMRCGSWDAAISVNNNTISLLPKMLRDAEGGYHITCLQNIGWCYFQKKDFKKSIECYKKLLDVSPDHWTALNNIAMSYLYLGDASNAEKFANRAAIRGRGVDSAHAYYTLARVNSHLLNKQEKALECLMEAVTIGLRDIKSVRKSEHLAALRSNELFQKSLIFAYRFGFVPGFFRHDIIITNDSGFPWTNVTLNLSILRKNEGDPEEKSFEYPRVDPAQFCEMKNITGITASDIASIFVQIVCDQGVWTVEHKPKNQSYVDRE